MQLSTTPVASLAFENIMCNRIICLSLTRPFKSIVEACELDNYVLGLMVSQIIASSFWFGVSGEKNHTVEHFSEKYRTVGYFSEWDLENFGATFLIKGIV